MPSNEDNGSSKISDPAWIKIVACVVGGLTFVLSVANSVATLYQQGELDSQKNQLEKQRIQLNEAKQQTDFQIALFDRAFTSLEKKNVQQQQALLVLLDSLDKKVDKDFTQKLISVITAESRDLETKFQGVFLQFGSLLNGGEIIYRAGSKDNYGFTDFDIFVCKPALQNEQKDNSLKLLDSILKVFDKTEKIGRIRVKIWNNNEFSTDQLKNKVTLIVYKDEKDEAKRIVDEIQRSPMPVSIPEISYQDDPSKKIDWLVKMVLCPSSN
jgi:hypothetical protein